MDLQKLDSVKGCNDGAECPILDPRTQLPTGIVITVYGPDSDLVQRLRREQSERAFAAMRGNRRRRLDQEAIEKEGLEFLARITKSWTGVEEGTTPIECNFDNAYSIYRRYPWLRQQVDDFAGDRTHFMTG